MGKIHNLYRPEHPKPEPEPSTTTEETPPINQCPHAIPGWSIINERQIYLGSPSVKILYREVDSNRCYII